METVFAVKEIRQKERLQRERMFARLFAAAALLLLALIGKIRQLTGAVNGSAGCGMLIAALLLLALAVLPAVRRAAKTGERKPAKPFGTVMRLVNTMVMYAFSLVGAILFPQYAPVATTGAHEVETATYTWTDESRPETYTDAGEDRAVTVEFFYPADEGSYPFVVFSHGAGGMIDSNYSTCSELASNGYVVASVAHPYHAIYVKDTNGKITPVDMEFMAMANGKAETLSDEEKLAMYADWMEIRTGDLNFVLDTALAKSADGEEGAFARIDSDKIGVFGHSLGGAASAELGRTREDVDAVIVLEGTMLGEYARAELTDGAFVYDDTPYPVPLLDANSRMQYDAAEEDGNYVNLSVVENAADAREVVFNDAAHMNFCDLPLVSPPLAALFGTGEVDARECIENVNGMTLEFFDHYLKGEPELAIPDEY